MASISNNRYERHRLETVFQDASIVHTTYRTNVQSRERRVAVQTTWTDKEELGAGGFGCVTLQQDVAGGQLRAVKRMLRGKGIDHSIRLASLTEVSDREDLFVQFFGWYEDRYLLFLAMEYMEHGNLSDYMKSEEEGKKTNLVEITRQVLEGLSTLHERNICHWNLKPQNILIASLHPIWVKITDFGVCRYSKDASPHMQVGTLGYLAPEILGIISRNGNGGSCTSAVDLWALGCIVYEMFTSQIPFIVCPTAPSCDQPEGNLELPTLCPQTDISLLHRFCSGFIQLPEDSLKACGANNDAIAFIKALLLPDPASRLSASAALQTEWLVKIVIPDSPDTLREAAETSDLLLDQIEPRLVEQQLIAAVSAGDTATVQLLLDGGADIEYRGEGQKTLLGLAARNGHIETAELLLDRGAEIAARDDNTNTALLHAAYTGHHEIVRLLLDCEANIEDVGGSGMTALLNAAVMGKTETVKYLLDRGAELEVRDQVQQTPLMLASFRGYIETVALLLDRGARIEDKTDKRNTALLLAVFRDQTRTVEYLLDRGADIHARNSAQDTALTIAASRGYTDLATLLLDRGARMEERGSHGYTALQQSAHNGRSIIVQLLFERGADIHAKADGNATTVMIAAFRGHTETVTLLLNYGVGIDERSDNGFTALLCAAFNGHNETVSLLLERGANMGARNDEGVTALLLAASQGQTGTVGILLDRGSHIEQVSKEGRTALSLAAINGRTETLKLLLDRGARITERDTNGNTALHLAAFYGQNECLELLLVRGAYTEENDYSDWTALFKAASQGKTATVEMLLNRGADINATDKMKRTALWDAESRGHTVTADLLRKKCAELEAKTITETVPPTPATPNETFQPPSDRKAHTESADSLSGEGVSEISESGGSGTRTHTLDTAGGASMPRRALSAHEST